jgi:predicted secreted protein
MDKNMIWAWAIKNSIALLSWAALAIVFGKWWIALFGLLFLSDLRTSTGGHYRICDRCGEHSETAPTKKEALEKAKKAGWLCLENESEDYCPDCVGDVPKLKRLRDGTS